MRRIGFILLLTVALSLAVSYGLWRDGLINYGAVPLPPLATPLQLKFGTVITTGMAEVLQTTLPHDFTTPRRFEQAIRAMSVAAGVNVSFRWDSLARAGVRPEAPVAVHVDGMKFGDALLAVAREQHARPPILCTATPNLLIVDAAERRLESVTRSYDVSDLAATKEQERQLVARIKADVKPQDWTRHPGFFRVSIIGGRLWVNQDLPGQRDVVQYLNDLRHRRAIGRFLRRTSLLTGAATSAVALVLIASFVRLRRRGRRLGLCLRCGYDLRASADRCPECGSSIAKPRAAAVHS